MLGTALTTGGAIPTNHTPRIYAAHVVAGAVMAGLGEGGLTAQVFDSMVAALAAMHRANPSWGPLFVRHPGNLARNVAYRRHSAA